jgi:hypothetical protein
MTLATLRAIAVQDGTYKVLSGEMDAFQFFDNYVDQSLFASSEEFVLLVNARVKSML